MEVLTMANYNDNGFLTNEEWVELIDKNWDALYEALEEAAFLAAQYTYNTYSVYLSDDNGVFIYENAQNIDDPHMIEIYTFKVPPRFLSIINQGFMHMDEQETISILKKYGMSDEYIDDYKDWFYNRSAVPRKPSEDINIWDLQYYDPELYDQILKDTAIHDLTLLYDFSIILSEYDW